MPHRGLVLALALMGPALPPGAPNAMSEETPANPLLEEWTTPFAVPPFDRIRPEHFRPAFDAALAAARKDVEAVASRTGAPTFANTVEVLELGGELLDRVDAVFSNLNSAETNDELQAIAKEVAPLEAALRDDIYLNDALFARVRAVWKKRDVLGLEPEQARLLEETGKDFLRSGANLDAPSKARLREINKELSVLTVTFAENVLKETNT